MSRPELSIVAGQQNADADIESVIRTLALLCAVYESNVVDIADPPSYSAGFRNGARSAYADVIDRLRNLRMDQDDPA